MKTEKTEILVKLLGEKGKKKFGGGQKGRGNSDRGTKIKIKET